MLACLFLLAFAVPAAHAQSPVCLGDQSAAGVPKLPGPALRMGINPAGEAGQLGPKIPLVPLDQGKTDAALARLKPPQGLLHIRLNRFFWDEGEAGIQKFLAATEHYTARGHPVELQLRYHPNERQEGDIKAWTEHVREVVRRFGPNPLVKAIQVTNEVNLTISPDSSDGSYDGARDALVQGVIAAKDESTKLGYDHLEIGFNWFYRTDPQSEASFWNHLRDKGGKPFANAVDWVGLDAYPGTVFPPAEYPGGERDGMVAAMSQLRKCFMPIPGLGAEVPIRVEENGWPTDPPARSEAQQVTALGDMVQAVHDFRGTYNVSDYRWFDLRDHNSSQGTFQSRYGLLRDDYSEKPAFGRYRSLVAELAAAEKAASKGEPVAPRLILRARCRGGRLSVRVGGPDVGSVRRVAFLRGARKVGGDARRPFRARLRFRGTRLTVRALLKSGQRGELRKRVRRC